MTENFSAFINGTVPAMDNLQTLIFFRFFMIAVILFGIGYYWVSRDLLANRAAERGLHWNPYQGLCPEAQKHTGPYQQFASEEAVYGALGLAFIAPQNREPDWIAKNIEFGL